MNERCPHLDYIWEIWLNAIFPKVTREVTEFSTKNRLNRHKLKVIYETLELFTLLSFLSCSLLQDICRDVMIGSRLKKSFP